MGCPRGMEHAQVTDMMLPPSSTIKEVKEGEDSDFLHRGL